MNTLQEYNESIKKRRVEILSMWSNDYDDIRCNAILYKNNIPKANIIASYDETTIRQYFDKIDSKFSDEFVENSFKKLLYCNFDDYLKLPKISKCSKLLQSIYDSVCESDASMCHITEEDWKEFYAEAYTEKDFKILQDEVKKHDLGDVIGINDAEYKIVGYGDLETRFNDDREIGRSREYER